MICLDHLASIRARYVTELTENIIPFWVRHGVDHRHGGFFSCLERDGTCHDPVKQMWMQWRAVYMFATLAQSAYGKTEYLDYAVKGFEFLFRHGRKADGSYYYLLTADGRPAAEGEAGAELYSESFAAIACAELYRATGDARYRDEAESAYRVFRNAIARSEAPSPLPGVTRRKQFGHYMISLNVLQMMSDAFADGSYLEELDACAAMLPLFRHEGTKIIFEQINADGSFDFSSQPGRFTNPGHGLEGIWFLLEYARKCSRGDMVPWAIDCCRTQLEYGWDVEQGGIVYFKDISGKPLAKNECMLKGWWPQNEAAVASLMAYEHSRDAYFFEKFLQIDAYAWKHLRDAEYGEWFAYAAVDGRQVHSYKGSRWKGFFHIPRYLLQSIMTLDRIMAR